MLSVDVDIPKFVKDTLIIRTYDHAYDLEFLLIKMKQLGYEYRLSSYGNLHTCSFNKRGLLNRSAQSTDEDLITAVHEAIYLIFRNETIY